MNKNVPIESRKFSSVDKIYCKTKQIYGIHPWFMFPNGKVAKLEKEIKRLAFSLLKEMWPRVASNFFEINLTWTYRNLNPLWHERGIIHGLCRKQLVFRSKHLPPPFILWFRRRSKNGFKIVFPFCIQWIQV